MTTDNQPRKPTTRSGFQSTMLSLSTRNEELEERLREAERNSHRLEMKNKSQHALILDLMDAIHSMTNSSASGDDNESGIPEEMCLLLTKNAQRISELSEEVGKMKFQLQQQMENHSTVRNNQVENESDVEDFRFVDISLCEEENENSSSTSSSARLEEEIVRISSKCDSLERSLKALKHKNSEREIRSMKSLRSLRNQVDSLEQERKRRLDLQASAEERALQLEIELQELKQENNRQSIFRRQRHESPLQEPEDSQKSDGKIESKQIETELTRKGLNHCRELVMMRNQLDMQSYPPLLLAVSEESEESEDSEDDFRPSVNAAVELE